MENKTAFFFGLIKLSDRERNIAISLAAIAFLAMRESKAWDRHLNDDNISITLLENENKRLRIERAEDKAEIKSQYIEIKGLLKERYGNIDSLAQANYKAIKLLKK